MTVSTPPPPPESEEMEDEQAPSTTTPDKYTLLDAFNNYGKHYMLRHHEERKHREDDLNLKWLSEEDKNKIREYYEHANNPSYSPGKFYVQYHVFDLTVMRSDERKAWKTIGEYFQTNGEGLFDNKYTKHLSYRLLNKRKCAGSYSTTIQIIVAYPRSRQKKTENAEQFLIDSGIKERLDNWKVVACKAYCFISKEEYLKLLDTHTNGCFVDKLESRFRASHSLAVESGSPIARVDSDDENNDDDDSIDGDEEAMITCRSSENDDDDDEPLPPADDNVDSGARMFGVPHPNIGTRREKTKCIMGRRTTIITKSQAFEKIHAIYSIHAAQLVRSAQTRDDSQRHSQRHKHPNLSREIIRQKKRSQQNSKS